MLTRPASASRLSRLVPENPSASGADIDWGRVRWRSAVLSHPSPHSLKHNNLHIRNTLGLFSPAHPRQAFARALPTLQATGETAAMIGTRTVHTWHVLTETLAACFHRYGRPDAIVYRNCIRKELRDPSGRAHTCENKILTKKKKGLPMLRINVTVLVTIALTQAV